jgi:hypothetical protein
MSGDTTQWVWLDELDALRAAPANHRLLLENSRRGIETVVPVEANTPVHTHRCASVEYVLSASSFVRRTVRELCCWTLVEPPIRSRCVPRRCGRTRSRPTRSKTSAIMSYA